MTVVKATASSKLYRRIKNDLRKAGTICGLLQFN